MFNFLFKKVTNVEIKLEPNKDGTLIYCPGQYLKGTVVLNLKNVEKLKGLYIKIYGQARAHWSENETRNVRNGNEVHQKSCTVNYEGIEFYLISKTYLFGQAEGLSLNINPGTHNYNFSCLLPKHLPFSMNTANGNIAYFAEVVLDTPTFFNKEFKTTFTVVRHDDLNVYPELRIAQKLEEVVSFCCLLWITGPLIMSVTLPYSGFAKGENIRITIDYINKSYVEVHKTMIALKQKIVYISHTPKRNIKTDIKNLVVLSLGDGVKGRSNNNFTVRFDIPENLMNSNDRFCEVIVISYTIEVIGDVNGCHQNPKIQIPITIGSIPIKSTNQYSSKAHFFEPSAPTEDEINNDAPPTYEESMRMGT